jgi:hypothetical protein
MRRVCRAVGQTEAASRAIKAAEPAISQDQQPVRSNAG